MIQDQGRSPFKESASFDDEAEIRFEALHAAGMTAKNNNDHEEALKLFEEANFLAQDYGEDKKRLNALQPAARALWTLGRYEDAAEKLATAKRIAQELGVTDEQGMIASNMGRLAAVSTFKTGQRASQAQELAETSVPFFQSALETLKGHPHFYFRYANAQHGSVIAALAGKRSLASRLIADGISVAFRSSEEPYDQEKTYRLGRGGLLQMAAATALIPFGGRTPFLASFARRKLVR